MSGPPAPETARQTAKYRHPQNYTFNFNEMKDF